MTNLTNQLPEYTYGDLLTTTNSGKGLDATFRNLQDGLGQNSTITISNRGINFNRSGGNVFQLDGSDLTASATDLNAAASGAILTINGTAGNISSNTVSKVCTINLVPTGVTPGVYNFANITVDNFGRITNATSSTGFVTSVSGTANQITSTGGTAPIIGLASNISGITSITSGSIILKNGSNSIQIFNSTNNDKITINADVSSGYSISLPSIPPNGSKQTLIVTDDFTQTYWDYQDLLARIISQNNTFVGGEIVRFDGTNYVKAQANSLANSEVVGFVHDATSSSKFTLGFSGIIILSGLTSGATYFLSPTTDGVATETKPSTSGQVIKPLFIAISTSVGVWINQRGNIIP
jgi:hypothetical protein